MDMVELAKQLAFFGLVLVEAFTARPVTTRFVSHVGRLAALGTFQLRAMANATTSATTFRNITDIALGARNAGLEILYTRATRRDLARFEERASHMMAGRTLDRLA